MKKYLISLCIIVLLSGCATTAYYQADKCQTKKEYFKAAGAPQGSGDRRIAKNGDIVETFLFRKFVIDEMRRIHWVAIFVNDKFYASSARASDITRILSEELGIDPKKDEDLYNLIHCLDSMPSGKEGVRLDAYHHD